MTTFVALDVETANSSRGSICSIGLVKFVNGEKVDSFYHLINPEEEFSSRNIKIHKIRPEDVTTEPTFPELRPKILEFISNLPVVAHNARFDISVLKAVYIKYHLDFDPIFYFCSYQVAQNLLPNIENYKLNNLSDYFNISLNHHNALSDAEACGLLFLKLMEQQQQNDIEKLLKLAGYEEMGLLGIKGFTKKRKSSYTNTPIRDVSQHTFKEKTDNNIQKHSNKQSVWKNILQILGIK
ncbi:3'-5' exonuclease [Streptococcus sp. ZJ93]|uniref:3'-5' exonuclease n=1 Tax=Streptococcus handemini TaxID=3161188 RepID=UPI0034D57F07